MDAILSFFEKMIPQVGIVPTVLLLLLSATTAVIVAFFFTLMNRKEKLMNKVIDEQSRYTQQTTEAMKVAITEIKELSIMSMSELRSLSSHIASFINLATSLLVNNQNNHTPPNQSPPSGGDAL